MTETRTSISAEEAAAFVSRAPAICIGPGATCYSGALSDLRRALLARFRDLSLPENGESYLDLGDIVSSLHSAKAESFRLAVREELQRLVASPDLAQLANVSWAACVSLTPDTLFERALGERLDRQASSRTMTVIATPTMVVPPRTIPVYKLFGFVHDESEDAGLAYSQSDFLFRQARWAGLLSTFADFVKDTPLFFVGTEDVAVVTAQFLASLFSGPRPHPNHLVFLRGDPTPTLPTVRGVLTRAGVKVSIVDSDVRELVRALELARNAPQKRRSDRPAQASEHSKRQWDQLASLKHIAERVPPRSEVLAEQKEVGREIIDGLFRPTSNDWRPYAHKLDLERTMLSQLLGVVLQPSQKPATLRNIVLHGAAGIGKTTLLRRLAVEVASEGHLVLWCNRASSESTSQLFRRLTKAIRELLVVEKRPNAQVFLFVDDPWSLRVSAADILTMLETAQFPATLIIGFRSSDYVSTGPYDAPFPGIPDAEFELGHLLDSGEIDRLPKMLVAIGACKDEAEAKELVTKNPYQRADDFLCSLWYLLPDTRSQFQASIEDEYRRLGDPRAVIEGAAASAINIGEVARVAYEAVTVASSLNIGLPVEILVRALDVDYADWTSIAQPGKPLWGLLYDELDSTNETYVYRTRNEIVTRVLLRLVNGVLGGHTGQYRLLKLLLGACVVASPPYRAFLHDVLVRSRSTLESMLTYEQGMDLYDTAIAAMPHSDRAIAHHRGLWIKNVGKDLAGADTQLRLALEIPDYPGSSREEPREYIHTSLAATALAQVRSGEISRDTGFERVVEHLRRASNSSYFNANQSHVLAGTLLDMAQISGSAPDALRLGCLGQALTEIERSLQMIGAPGRKAIRHQKALALFEDLQRRAVEALSDVSDMPSAAKSLFSSNKSQVGLEAWARSALLDATRADSGSDYKAAQDVLIEMFKLVTDAGQVPSPELRAVRVDLIVRWRLQHAKGAVDWKTFLEDLEQLVRSPRYRDDTIKKFYYAVALYQQGRITEANAAFSALRREQGGTSPSSIRCFYVGAAGFPKRFQGTSHTSHGRRYVTIHELGDDVIVQGPIEAGPGGTEHVYVAFTLNGPVAVTRTPGPEDLILP